MSAYGSRGASLRTIALASASVLSLCLMGSAARAQTVFNFDIPQQPLSEALRAYARVAGDQIIFNDDLTRGRTATLHGTYTPDEALAKILKGSKLTAERLTANEVMVGPMPEPQRVKLTQVAAGAMPVRAAAAAGIESVVVTSSKIKGDIQTVPIAITALSQEQLTSRQIAGGPDLVKEVPNLTFSKTNFSGYTIQIRGIGTQAISVTTDPAVAVALNDIPFIRNHFFEQEFFDVNQVEVLRGPQGTLYGRNATAGVVNVVTAKPTDQFEAALSADWGNYHNRRYEGMVNIPIVDDRVDLRIAGEWTKREGYTTNQTTGSQVDGRDLWSTRVTLAWKPTEKLQATLVWEHFGEQDDRMRTAKQLCKTDHGLTSVLGVPVPPVSSGGVNTAFQLSNNYLSQGCLPVSLYSPEAFEVPNGFSLPYVIAGWATGHMFSTFDPYASTTQSRDLRTIETQINPRYNAKNDTLELNADYAATPSLTFTSQTGYNNDSLWSTEDYNRFNTAPGIFTTVPFPGSDQRGTVTYLGADGTYYFCDPQLGCSNRLVAQDVSSEHAWQFSQEFRLASNFTGPFNFSVGGNYMHYETVEDYYVFANTLTMFAATGYNSGAGDINDPWVAGVSDNHQCLTVPFGTPIADSTGGIHQYHDPNGGAGIPTETCSYIDPNPLGSVNGLGHNYFVSHNPYVLNSYAGFGEAYYNVLSDLKLTGGIRWTDDQKHFTDIPSELLVHGIGLLPTAVVDQKWNQLTGRFAANWTPKLDFTDQTLIYGSFSHGYKAGGANPPGAELSDYAGAAGFGVPIHPLIFKPEFVDAFELGSKNTLLDGGLTLNGDVFFYNYKGYQISRIVDRTAINDNFDAKVEGAELEASYEPIPGLKFNFAGGYEDTRINNGQSSIDLMDRTAGHPGWVLMKPFLTEASNCVFPDYVVAAMLGTGGQGNAAVSSCGTAYHGGLDPVPGNGNAVYFYNNGSPFYRIYNNTGGFDDFSYPIAAPNNSGLIYPGFDPNAGGVDPRTGLPDPYLGQNTYNGHDYGPAPNNGAGFAKNVGGNALPNAPHFTTSLSADYTLPVSEDWAATVHGDFYWQSQSWARVFNDRPYDKIRGYSNVNLALILTSASGWQVMGYLKNVFDTTAITGDFLNSDDSGLTTNVFLTDPRLFGVRVTRNW